MKKKLITAIAAGAMTLGLAAKDGSGLIIYINPGHGGHDSDDRNVVIAPYASGDPEGYWESNSNLDKGLALRDMLQAKGYTVFISRTTNTSADDLGLTTISTLANEANADLFFSIHSNATGTTARRNFPLMLFKGYDDTPAKPKDKELCGVLNKYLLQNQVTYWSSTATNVRGDWSFYPSWGTQGLGVLRHLTVTGMLSEGSFHDYIPETYRLMNKDFCWLEAWHFRKAVDEYLGVDGIADGAVMGRINDTRVPREGNYVILGDDQFATIQGVKVELYDSNGNLVDTYTTETKHLNGVYAFKSVAPGHYTIKASVDTHYPVETEVDVVADQVSYANLKMSKVRNTPPVVESYSPVWNAGDEPVLCNTPVVIQFNWDMDQALTEKAFVIEPPVEGKFTWEDLNYRMVFTPTVPYSTNTEYTVTVTTGATHAGGMAMEQPVSFKFATTDRNYMDVLGEFPKQGEAVHFHDAAIEFRFDKRPNTSMILNQVTCTDSKGNSVAFNKRKMTSSNVNSEYGFFRIPFGGDLTVGETYRLNISGDFGDKDGITIKDPVDITFTAVDAGTEKEGTVIEDMEDASLYANDEEGSVNLASSSVATNKTSKLFGNGCVAFTYSFSDTEGGESLWERSAPAETVVNDGCTVGIHVNGDLTANTVYLQFTSETDVQYVEVCNMDFLGWRYLEIPLLTLEGNKDYRMTGVKIVQKESQMSKSGTFMIDDINIAGGGAGVESVELESLTLYPNPATEYLIANADMVIDAISLTSMSGVEIAKTTGNVLNVSEIPSGHYIATVYAAGTRSVRKVVIAH